MGISIAFSNAANSPEAGPVGQEKGASFRSNERRAFCSASAKERPIAMASPTDFMVVVRRGSASANFSKANRGALTTT